MITILGTTGTLEWVGERQRGGYDIRGMYMNSGSFCWRMWNSCGLPFERVREIFDCYIEVICIPRGIQNRLVPTRLQSEKLMCVLNKISTHLFSLLLNCCFVPHRPSTLSRETTPTPTAKTYPTTNINIPYIPSLLDHQTTLLENQPPPSLYDCGSHSSDVYADFTNIEAVPLASMVAHFGYQRYLESIPRV